jgi:murein L,D-transpeptidase YafK
MKWVCLKEERLLLVFAPKPDGNWVELMSLPVRGASGTTGPKLKTGDLQVPEGFYRIAALDATIKLLMWVNYPNAFDWSHAQKEHRSRPGYGIQIHGGSYSTGCLAMGNDKIGDLWTLAHDTGINNIELIYSPCNLLVRKPKIDFTKQPAWLPGLYKQLQASLSTLPVREKI